MSTKILKTSTTGQRQLPISPTRHLDNADLGALLEAADLLTHRYHSARKSRLLGNCWQCKITHSGRFIDFTTDHRTNVDLVPQKRDIALVRHLSLGRRCLHMPHLPHLHRNPPLLQRQLQEHGDTPSLTRLRDGRMPRPSQTRILNKSYTMWEA
jgi:hypothetical protein